jgi:hypothetical protein
MMRRTLLASAMGLLLLGLAACAATGDPPAQTSQYGTDGWGGHTISLFPPSSSDG